ncbi:Disease resistance protein RPS2 [Camellia lanceoleosa]|uniref:Disease resistance protein RPS2 n=1 Tax=Camellia lanceoleosa TaxID=1840588 RepID=A0ACC0IRM8_9ERIC|nr:Disease resistance protein RPS2 [Camellia lanceoleosa]
MSEATSAVGASSCNVFRPPTAMIPGQLPPPHPMSVKPSISLLETLELKKPEASCTSTILHSLVYWIKILTKALRFLMAETIAIVGAVSSAVGVAAGVAQAASQAKPIFWDPPMDKVEEIHDAVNAAIHALSSIRKDFMNEVKRNKMKAPSETYMEWINRAVEIEKQVKFSADEYGKHSKEESSFWFPSSLYFKEEMIKMYKEVTNLLNEGNQIRNKILVDQPPEIVVERKGPDINKFETLRKPIEQILDLLEKDYVKGIRTHGTVDSDINTDYLLECWAAEDLLGNDDCAMKESIMIGHLILSRLKNVSILEKDSPNCSLLSTLLLQENSALNMIPALFFEHMKNLQRLRVSFAKSRNENASQEVHFNYNTISKLSKFEELVIDVKSPEQWSNEVVENIIKEVAALQKLRSLKFSFSDKFVDVIEVAPMTLRISVPKATILLSFIKSSSWKDVQSINSFEFYIGCQNSEPQIPDFFRYDKCVKYSNSAGSYSPILRVLAEADGFEIVNLKDIKQLSDFGIASMNKVQGCLIESCDEIGTIAGAVDSAVLPNLEHLLDLWFLQVLSLLMAETIAVIGAAAGVMQAVSQAKPIFWDPLMTKVNLSENVEEIHYYLNDAVNNLVSVKMDFKNAVERNKVKKPSEAYLEWNCRVMKTEEVEELVANYKKPSKRFSFPSHSSFKEKMKKMYKRVINLQDEGDQIREKILVNRPQETVVNMRAPDIKKFETLQKSLEQILDMLKGNMVKGIRIRGPLGIGKTTIMLNLNNHEQVAKMFDIVIWLKVSKEGSKENLSRKYLQQDIVQRLQLKMGDTSNADEVAQRILMKLKDKNYLLLLDDVKDDINLYEIGIP